MRERTKYAEAFFRKGEVGSWREELTPEQVRRMTAYHGEQMRRLATSRPAMSRGELELWQECHAHG